MTETLDLIARTSAQAGWGGGGPGPWWILVPVIWIAIVATVVWLLARRRGSGHPGGAGGAESILAARFARGEIDTEEYRSRLDELRGAS